MARRWTVLPAAAMITCFTGGWLLQREVAAQGDVYQQARLFETVMAYVRDYHVDSIAEPELYRRAADGLLANLHDPYAALLSGKDLEKHVERTTGDYAGIGLLVDSRNGWVTVVSPMRGSPAERAGIRDGRPARRGGWPGSGGLDARPRGAGDARQDRHGGGDRGAAGQRREATPFPPGARADPPGRSAARRPAPRGRRIPQHVDGAGECLGGAGARDRRPHEPGHARPPAWTFAAIRAGSATRPWKWPICSSTPGTRFW